VNQTVSVSARLKVPKSALFEFNRSSILLIDFDTTDEEARKITGEASAVAEAKTHS